MAVDLSDSAMVVAGNEHSSCPLGDTIVLLDARAGLYFSLDNVGASIWKLLQQPRTVKEIRQSILDEFEVDPETCQRDLLAFLQDLAVRNLIEIRDAAAV
jgi:hypothetical protein